MARLNLMSVSRIAVAGPSDVVTRAAIDVANEGGSVVDVAIVAALTAMCTEPGVCGPGGGGFLTIDLPEHDPVVVDGYMAYPGKGFGGEPFTREVRMTYGGGVTTLVDAGSVAVPGAFSAFDMAWEMFGMVPWPVLMGTVADAVADGFPLSYAAHHYLNEGAAPIYRSDPVALEALFEGDDARPMGANIVFAGLAETLRYIGQSGAEVFYRGDLGAGIVDDLLSRGGQLTRQDMSAYRAIARRPLVTEVGEWNLALNPAPAVGGLAVSRVLQALQTFEDHGPIGRARALIDAFQARQRDALRSPSTVSVAAADDKGGAVAASFSAGYGSGLIPRGTGMLMNNSVGELELVAGSATARPPGERMISNMAPTVARRGEEAVAVGSPGADRITTAIACTLWHIASGDTLAGAIDHPRVHPEFGDYGIRVAAEPGQDLAGVGLPVREFDGLHMFFGGVNGAGLLDGALQAHADARRTGSVAFSH